MFIFVVCIILNLCYYENKSQITKKILLIGFSVLFILACSDPTKDIEILQNEPKVVDSWLSFDSR